MSKSYYAPLLLALSFNAYAATDTEPAKNLALEFLEEQEQQIKACGSKLYNNLDQIFTRPRPHLEAFLFSNILKSPRVKLDETLRKIYEPCTDPETVSTAFCQIKKDEIDRNTQHCDPNNPAIMETPICHDFSEAPLKALSLECGNTPDSPPCAEFGSALQETFLILEQFLQCTGQDEQKINKAACHAQDTAQAQGNYKVESTVSELCFPAELERSF